MDIKGSTNLTITVRDDDTLNETLVKISLFDLTMSQAVRRVGSVVGGAVRELLGGGYMSDKKKKLDHDQDKTDQIAKSENPDPGFMKSASLCQKCHGPLQICDRDECPQKR